MVLYSLQQKGTPYERGLYFMFMSQKFAVNGYWYFYFYGFTV